MAQILDQKEIDRAIKAIDAARKIECNYSEITGLNCRYDLRRKGQLLMCVSEIAKAKVVTKDQKVFIKQCDEMIERLKGGNRG